MHSLRRGFTLIEFLVVMGIFLLVGGFALIVSFETYRGSNFRSDRDLLISILERARSESINNVCVGTCTDGVMHGVHIDATKYVLFQGAIYSAVDPLNATFVTSVTTRMPTSTDIVFEQLTGNASTSSLTLSDQSGHSSVISLGNFGQITWTH